MNRDDLTDAQWQQLEPLLPPQKPKTGRPAHDHRQKVNGILWILRTGAPWRDLAERYGPWQTVASRFYRWDQSGVWDRVWATLQAQADAGGAFDWSVHYVNGTIIRPTSMRLEPRPGGLPLRRWDVARGALAPKCICAPKGQASPRLLCSPRPKRHEAVVFPQLMEGGVVKRAGRGRPRCRPRRIVGDKAMSHPGDPTLGASSRYSHHDSAQA